MDTSTKCNVYIKKGEGTDGILLHQGTWNMDSTNLVPDDTNCTWLEYTITDTVNLTKDGIYTIQLTADKNSPPPSGFSLIENSDVNDGSYFFIPVILLLLLRGGDLAMQVWVEKQEQLTNKLEFVYTVKDGDNLLTGIETKENPLILDSDVKIQDYAGNDIASTFAKQNFPEYIVMTTPPY